MTLSIRTAAFIFLSVITFNSFSQQKTVEHNLVFETYTQNMWGPNGQAFTLNDTIELSPPFAFDFDLNTFDETIFSIAGGQFGVGFDIFMDVVIGGFEFRITGLTSGDVDVYYDVDVSLDMPADRTFNKGQEIVIGSSLGVNPSSYIATNFPSAGEIALELPIKMDVGMQVKPCFLDCLDPEYIIEGERGLPYTIDERFAIFRLNVDEFTYACPEPTQLFQCTMGTGIPYTISRNGLSGTFALPSVTTNSYIIGKDVFADGSNPYFTMNLDVIEFIGALRIPKVSAFFRALNGSIVIPERGIPDITGTPRSIELFWNLISVQFEVPFGTTQEFVFEPDVFAELTFPTPIHYRFIDLGGNEVSSSTPQNLINFPVGNNLTIQYPCNYDFMDINARYIIDNDFSNKTYDGFTVDLIFSAIEFGFNIDKYVVVPGFTVDIPFIGEVTFPEIASPEYAWSFGPVIGPYRETLARVDLPPYFDQTWELEGFDDFPIDEPFQLRPREQMLFVQADTTSCFDSEDGALAVIDSGYTPPLSYQWDDQSNDAQLTRLGRGTYYAKVTDKNGCTGFIDGSVLSPEPITVESTKADNICYGDEDGTIDLGVVGGTGVIQYEWSNGSLTKDQNSLAAGTYSVNITDENSCQVTRDFEITQPDSLEIAWSRITEPTCFENEDGRIISVVQGGTKPYEYNWDHGVQSPSLLTASAGEYTLTVTDKNNCQASASARLNEPDPLQVDLNVEQQVSCFNGMDGRLTAGVIGGTTPYDYNWFLEESALSRNRERITGLPSGLYRMEVEDAQGCKLAESIVLPQPETPLTVNIQNKEDVSCPGFNDGQALAVAAGGTLPYNYAWSSNETNAQANSLTGGKNTVTITDNNDCSITENVYLFNPSEVFLIETIEPVSCALLTDGAIKLNAVGGTGPYTYQWSTGETGPAISNLDQGQYNVTVADANGCEKTKSYFVPKNNVDCLQIPTAFSPNDDGVNDLWELKNIDLYENATVKIINRWGQTLYESAELTKYWDGLRNGRKMPAGTYYYILNLGDGSEPLSGPLTIKY